MNNSFQETDTINDVLKRAPGAATLLHRLSLDTCCGAGRSIREAAEVAKMPVEELLAQLNEGQDASAPAAPDACRL